MSDVRFALWLRGGGNWMVDSELMEGVAEAGLMSLKIVIQLVVERLKKLGA